LIHFYKRKLDSFDPENMDFGVFFIFMGVFGLCAGLVLVVSLLGVQGETYEEALEKQSNRSKEKEKKKVPIEKKKKVKKAKESKSSQNNEEENLLFDPAGNRVEPVYVEDIPTQDYQQDGKFIENQIVKSESKQKSKKEKKVVEQIAQSEAPKETNVGLLQKKNPPKLENNNSENPDMMSNNQGPAQADFMNEGKKMEIVDVDEIQVPEVEKKKKVGKEKQKPLKGKFEEIQDLIRKAALSDVETQGVIELLLKNQTGRREKTSDWIEPGKESESRKLSRKVTELESDLKDEKEKSGNLEKKIISLRKELNEGRSSAAIHKREQEEMISQKTQEVNSINSRLQQIVTQMNSTLALNRKLEASQSHYQATISSLQAQLSQTSGDTDSKLLAEIEHLKNARNDMTSGNHALQQQLALKCNEVEAITTSKIQAESQLIKVSEELKQARSELDEERAGSKHLKSQLDEKLSSSSVERENIECILKENTSKVSGLEASLSAAKDSNQQLQKEMNILQARLSEKEIETSRLMEEHERLSEQVASSFERPAADGEESKIMNGHGHEDEKSKMVPEISAWEEKCSLLSQQLQKSQTRIGELENENRLTKSEVCSLRNRNEGLASKQSTAEEVSRLEAQNCNYKIVLAQTENMLTNLQDSVESTEIEWKKKLALVERQNTENKLEVQELRSKNVSLQNSVDSLTKKVQGLESGNPELEKEKRSKEMLAVKCTELQELVVSGIQFGGNKEA